MEKIFGPDYTKIHTAFKRDEKNVIIDGQWTLPEFVYLQDNPWIWMEKVDGTNIRLHWNGEKAVIGGRTDSASIPTFLLAALEPYTDPGTWKRMFPDGDDVTLYGEGYGARIQKVGHLYRKDAGFILFDVRIGDWWLRDESIREVADGFGLDVVPQMGAFTLNQAWHNIKEGNFTSRWEGVPIEGVVGRPEVPLFTRKGQRVITKLKMKDWQDYQRSQEK